MGPMRSWVWARPCSCWSASTGSTTSSNRARWFSTRVRWQARSARASGSWAAASFVRRESARAIITAASIWVVAAIGMTAGADLYVPAAAATIADLLILLAFTPVTERLRRAEEVVGDLTLTYRQGTGVLRQAMTELTHCGEALRHR